MYSYKFKTTAVKAMEGLHRLFKNFIFDYVEIEQDNFNACH